MPPFLPWTPAAFNLRITTCPWKFGWTRSWPVAALPLPRVSFLARKIIIRKDSGIPESWKTPNGYAGDLKYVVLFSFSRKSAPINQSTLVKQDCTIQNSNNLFSQEKYLDASSQWKVPTYTPENAQDLFFIGSYTMVVFSSITELATLFLSSKYQSSLLSQV